MSRYKKAKIQALKQTGIHDDFTAHLPERVVERWIERVEAWERDQQESNPYINDVKRQFLLISPVLLFAY